jgi:hypothetical protein
LPTCQCWSSQGSLTSPVDNLFHGSSIYPLSSGHASASSSVFTCRGAPNEKRPGPNDSMLSLIQLQRPEMGWSSAVGPAPSSGHTMSRGRDSAIQSDTRPSVHSQSRRFSTVTRTDSKFFSRKFEFLKSLIFKSKLAATNTELLGSIVLPLGQGPTGSTVCTTDRSKQLPSPIECFLRPPSLADATGQSRTQTVLQGTISALKLIQQIVGLAPVPGLQSLVGVVLNISEIVNVSFDFTHISHVKY